MFDHILRFLAFHPLDVLNNVCERAYSFHYGQCFQSRFVLHHLIVNLGDPTAVAYPTQAESSPGTIRGEKGRKREKRYECTYGCQDKGHHLKMATKQDWTRHEHDFHAAGNVFYCLQNNKLCSPEPFYDFKQLQNHQKSAGKFSHPHHCSHNNCAKSPHGCPHMTKVPHDVEQVYHCGFCGNSYPGSSKHRRDHIAEHFGAGLTMDPDWRFPKPLIPPWPATDMYGSNAMPFQDPQGMDQYAAQSMASKDSLSTPIVPDDTFSGHSGLPYRT